VTQLSRVVGIPARRDRSLTVSGGIPLGDTWNQLATVNAAPGMYPLTIHAGGADWPITLTVLDHRAQPAR